MLENLTLREDPQQTRDLVGRTLSLRASTIDEKSRSFEVTMSSDAAVAVYDFNRWEIIDEVLRTEGATFPDQVPLLANHSRYSLDDVIGSVRGMRIEGNKLVGRAHMAEGDEDSDKAWNKVRQGHISDVSIGYRSTEYVDIPPNQKQTVAGREYAAGKRTLRVTTKYEVRELSLVPIGADRNAKVRKAAADAAKETPMNPQLRKYLESIGLRSDASEQQAQAFLAKLKAGQKTRAEAIDAESMTLEDALREELADSRTKPADPAPVKRGKAKVEEPEEDGDDPEAIRAEAQKAERDRQSAIRALAGEDVDAKLVTRAIDEGWTQERAGVEFLKNVRESRTPSVGTDAPGGIVRSHERDCNVRTLGVALVIRAGMSDDQIKAAIVRAGFSRSDKWENIAERAHRYNDLSLLDICREAVRLDGRETPVGRSETIRAAVSGGSLTNIFTTSVNARLMMAWEEADDSAVFAQDVDVADFKTMDEIDITANARLKRLGRGGTAEDADMGDAKETWRIARYAKKFSVDEQDIIDDSMSVLTTAPEEMGRAARRLRPDLVYALLLANPTLNADSVAVFHAASHGNLGSGAGSALSAAALKAGITAMSKQTKGSGKNVVQLNIRPKYLIVPQDLVFTARELVHSAEIRDTTASTERGTKNVIADENLTIIADNRIGTAGVVDPTTDAVRTGTATNWFLAGSRRTVKVGFLRGTGRGPSVRPYSLDKGQWGVGWDIKLDIGAMIEDFRALYKAPGA